MKLEEYKEPSLCCDEEDEETEDERNDDEEPPQKKSRKQWHSRDTFSLNLFCIPFYVKLNKIVIIYTVRLFSVFFLYKFLSEMTVILRYH